MTSRGVDFLEGWIGKTITAQTDVADAGKMTAKLVAAGATAGFTLADMELDPETVEAYVRDAIVHVREPGTPGD